jgi:hypothetical protein
LSNAEATTGGEGAQDARLKRKRSALLARTLAVHLDLARRFDVTVDDPPAGLRPGRASNRKRKRAESECRENPLS